VVRGQTHLLTDIQPTCKRSPSSGPTSDSPPSKVELPDYSGTRSSVPATRAHSQKSPALADQSGHLLAPAEEPKEPALSRVPPRSR